MTIVGCEAHTLSLSQDAHSRRVIVSSASQKLGVLRRDAMAHAYVHEGLGRADGEALLQRSGAVEGSFVVRSKNDGTFVLSMMSKGRCVYVCSICACPRAAMQCLAAVVAVACCTWPFAKGVVFSPTVDSSTCNALTCASLPVGPCTISCATWGTRGLSMVIVVHAAMLPCCHAAMLPCRACFNGPTPVDDPRWH